MTTPANTAVIPVWPGATPVATPCWLLIVATDGSVEAHVALFVSDTGGPCEKLPVAVNGTETPKGTLAVVGVTEMDTSGY